MGKKNILFIINPFSGTSDKHGLVDLIQMYLDHSIYIYEVLYTEYGGHAELLGRAAVDRGVDIVVAVGGDGTINEVARGLLFSDTHLAIIPMGSGNGFASHLGISKNIKKSILTINFGHSILIDTCKVNDLFFINISGVGFDGYVSNLLKGQSKRGKRLYLINMLKAFRSYVSKRYKIEIDGKVIEGDFYCVVIANASTYGYKFKIAPNANLSDGFLDVVLMKNSSFLQRIISFRHFFTSTVEKISYLDIIKAKSISIKSDFLLDFHVDGEGLNSNKELIYTLNPESLNVIANHKKNLN